MDIVPFFVEFLHDNKWVLAEVKPCCQENNVFYYDISINNQFQYTITPGLNDAENPGWKIALKNADKEVDPEFLQIIGEQIEKHYVM